MSATGLEVFDRTLQATHGWLNQIAETVGPDKQRCYHALRAVLHTVRDRLPIDIAAHLSAQLPMLVRGIYWEAYKPAGKPERIRDPDEFVARVVDHLPPAPSIDPRDAIRAVFAVLERHIDPGEFDAVRQALPIEVRALFEAPAAPRRD